MKLLIPLLLISLLLFAAPASAASNPVANFLDHMISGYLAFMTGKVTLTPSGPPVQFPNSDLDEDGIMDVDDNCSMTYNPDQYDTDGDGKGDACDPIAAQGSDTDGDGALDFEDNCPYDWNPDQADADGDNIGDVCDDSSGGDPVQDSDVDGIPDSSDNCPLAGNPTQTDLDGDGLGDACDTLCPTVVNDADEDTYISKACGGNDCDDYDHTIYPGAPELCDYFDNNCNLAVDESCNNVLSTSCNYIDTDGDLFNSCVDCDDQDYLTYPGAYELIDQIDNDCDGLVDDDEGVNTYQQTPTTPAATSPTQPSLPFSTPQEELPAYLAPEAGLPTYLDPVAATNILVLLETIHTNLIQEIRPRTQVLQDIYRDDPQIATVNALIDSIIQKLDNMIIELQSNSETVERVAIYQGIADTQKKLDQLKSLLT